MGHQVLTYITTLCGESEPALRFGFRYRKESYKYSVFRDRKGISLHSGVLYQNQLHFRNFVPETPLLICLGARG